jgi:hypothetical protein
LLPSWGQKQLVLLLHQLLHLLQMPLTSPQLLLLLVLLVLALLLLLLLLLLVRALPLLLVLLLFLGWLRQLQQVHCCPHQQSAGMCRWPLYRHLLQ